MFHRFLNDIRFKIQIRPDGPILVKAGVDASGKAQMNFVRTMRGGRQQVYLPGSSLKGALRAHAESIARTLRGDSVCNPFNTHYRKKGENNSPWGLPNCYDTMSEGSKNLTPTDRFRFSCPACQLFGSLISAGHFSASDGYLLEPESTADPEIRDGVAIDRFSGGTYKSGKFQFEALSDGIFEATLILHNVAWWQVSWIALVLRDMCDGMLPIGMGTSRGLGRIQTSIEKMTIDLVGFEDDEMIPAIAEMFEGAEAYGFDQEDPLIVPDGLVWENRGIRRRLTLEKDRIPPFLTDLYPLFVRRVQGVTLMQDWRREQKKSEGLLDLTPSREVS